MHDIEKVCSVCGATVNESTIKWCSKTGSYLCSKHYAQIYRHGKITDKTKRTITQMNDFDPHDTYVEIVLRDSKQKITGIAIIDPEDYDKCKNIKWTLDHKGYVRGGKEKIKLHRHVLNYSGDQDVDHINRNKLDNRKENLRIVHRSVNSGNNSAVGASLDKTTGKWRAYLQRYGKVYTLGYYDTYEEAYEARQKKDIELKSREEELIAEYIERSGNHVKGVSLKPSGKWEANIRYNKTKHYIGTFNTKEEAVAARSEYEIKLMDGTA